jgi:hypothetical protein
MSVLAERHRDLAIQLKQDITREETLINLASGGLHNTGKPMKIWAGDRVYHYYNSECLGSSEITRITRRQGGGQNVHYGGHKWSYARRRLLR